MEIYIREHIDSYYSTTPQKKVNSGFNMLLLDVTGNINCEAEGATDPH